MKLWIYDNNNNNNNNNDNNKTCIVPISILLFSSMLKKTKQSRTIKLKLQKLPRLLKLKK